MTPASPALQSAFELALLSALPAGAAHPEARHLLLAARERLEAPLLGKAGAAEQPALAAALLAAYLAVLKRMPGPVAAEQDNTGWIQRQA